MTSRLVLSCTLLALLTACSAGRAASTPIIRVIRFPHVFSPSTAHEDFTFETHDGLTLRGWLFRPEGKPKGLFVYLHGFDNNRILGADIAERLVPKGWAVLAYDQRAHGASEGTYCTYGINEVRDLQRALDEVGIDGPIVVSGESMGAAVALQAAAVEPRIDAVIAAAPFSDLRVVVGEIAGPLNDDEVLMIAVDDNVHEEAGFRLDDVSPRRAAGKITAPALLFHGTSDLLIHPSHSRRIFEALRGEKRLVTVQNASHYDILRHEEIWDEIERWLAAVPRG